MDMNIMDMNMTMVKQACIPRILWQGSPLPTTLVLSNAFTTDT